MRVTLANGETWSIGELEAAMAELASITATLSPNTMRYFAQCLSTQTRLQKLAEEYLAERVARACKLLGQQDDKAYQRGLDALHAVTREQWQAALLGAAADGRVWQPTAPDLLRFLEERQNAIENDPFASAWSEWQHATAAVAALRTARH